MTDFIDQDDPYAGFPTLDDPEYLKFLEDQQAGVDAFNQMREFLERLQDGRSQR